MTPNSHDSTGLRKKRIELQRRRVRGRNNLLDFCRFTKPDYQTPDHICIIADALERVECGDCKRLILCAPPRHGKSEITVVRAPPWMLGRHPDWNIVVSGYSEGISLRHSRSAREVYRSAEYADIFRGRRLGKTDRDRREFLQQSKAAHEWETGQGGSYYAVGIGGGLIGRGMRIGFIDDPYPSREAAQSKKYQAKVLDWYHSVFYTRLEPNAAIVIIMTRWHPNDLVGVLLREMKEDPEADQWEVIKIPAVKPGRYDALWPERYNAAALQRIRNSVTEHEWSAQYLQEPVIRGGNRFLVDGIQIHDTLDDFPEGRDIRAWDLASSKVERATSDPDYTVGGLGTITQDKHGFCHLWIKDAVFGQWEAPERDSKIRATTARDGPEVHIYMEAFGGYKDAYTTTKKLLTGLRTVHASKLPGDKVVKCSALEPIFEAGHVHLLRGSWNDLLVQQFRDFPNGTHDDFCDMAAIIYHESIGPKSELLAIA